MKQSRVSKNQAKERSSILIVDDEKTVVDSLDRILKILGYEVYKAKNAEEGLREFNKYKKQIKLVFSDMKMPGLSGKDFFYKVKKECSNVKFVIISAYSVANDVTQMFKDGLDGFLQKPFSIDNLKAILNELL